MKKSSPAARYVVGIDLGTTNSVVAYVPVDGEAPSIAVLAIPQLTAPGTVEERSLLPSFLYLPAAGELPAAARCINACTSSASIHRKTAAR